VIRGNDEITQQMHNECYSRNGQACYVLWIVIYILNQNRALNTAHCGGHVIARHARHDFTRKPNGRSVRTHLRFLLYVSHLAPRLAPQSARGEAAPPWTTLRFSCTTSTRRVKGNGYLAKSYSHTWSAPLASTWLKSVLLDFF
jgi:hypothetical protein